MYGMRPPDYDCERNEAGILPSALICFGSKCEPRQNMGMLKTTSMGVLVGFTIAAGILSTGGDVLAQPQTCGLLTSEEVQALAPKKQAVSDAAVGGNQGGGAVSCRYTWGSGVGHFTLTLSTRQASRVFAGMNPASIRQSLLATVRP